MSKTPDEQATDVVVALLSTEKGLNYLGDSNAQKMGKDLAAVWTEVYSAILDRRIHPNRT